MRLAIAFLLMLAFGLGACSGDDRGEDQATATTMTTTLPPPTVTTTTTTTTTPTTTTTTTVVVPVVLATEGAVTVGEADGETVFKLSHDVTGFADFEMVRAPDGDLGWKGGIWVTVDEVRHQAEINRWWPPDQPLDVILLTSNPSKGGFVVFDALTLEGELDRFALHGDCQTPAGDVGAALLSFDYGTPEPLIAWEIDRATMTFVVRDVVEGVELGDCLPVEPRDT